MRLVMFNCLEHLGIDMAGAFAKFSSIASKFPVQGGVRGRLDFFWFVTDPVCSNFVIIFTMRLGASSN